ncbi:MAG: hypothetical protein RIQ96_642, partial [Pseudomonadota bacterium]
ILLIPDAKLLIFVNSDIGIRPR